MNDLRFSDNCEGCPLSEISYAECNMSTEAINDTCCEVYHWMCNFRKEIIDEEFKRFMSLIKNGYDYPTKEFKETFIALLDDAIKTIKDNDIYERT